MLPLASLVWLFYVLGLMSRFCPSQCCFISQKQPALTDSKRHIKCFCESEDLPEKKNGTQMPPNTPITFVSRRRALLIFSLNPTVMPASIRACVTYDFWKAVAAVTLKSTWPQRRSVLSAMILASIAGFKRLFSPQTRHNLLGASIVGA